MNSDWTKDYFQGLALEAWRAHNTPEATSADADFIAAVLGLEPGARVLDVPCGDGRLALELARRGYSVTGVDQDDAQLESAEAEGRAEKLSIQWRRSNMRRIRLRGGFDGAFCYGNSFGYFGAEDTAGFLGCLGVSLRTGGMALIDTEVAAECLLPNLEDRVWQEAGGISVLAEYDYDTLNSRLESRMTFIRGNEREERVSTQWVFTIGEITRMLAASGLEVQTLFADLEQTPFQPGDPRLFLVAMKQ
jgi:SAM-dependent methyltransferase